MNESTFSGFIGLTANDEGDQSIRVTLQEVGEFVAPGLIMMAILIPIFSLTNAVG